MPFARMGPGENRCLRAFDSGAHLHLAVHLQAAGEGGERERERERESQNEWLN